MDTLTDLYSRVLFAYGDVFGVQAQIDAQEAFIHNRAVSYEAGVWQAIDSMATEISTVLYRELQQEVV